VVTVMRRTRARRATVRYGRPAEVSTWTFPLGAAIRLMVALFVRRYAWRVIAWTRRMEAGAYSRAQLAELAPTWAPSIVNEYVREM
jgi:hypothetical protein